MKLLKQLKEKIIDADIPLTFEEAREICSIDNSNVEALVKISSQLTLKYQSKNVYLCSIISARTGGCSEDCSFCAQSIYNDPIYPYQPFIEPEKILMAAKKAELSGASEFCIVSSGKGPNKGTMKKVLEAVSLIRSNTSLSVGCSLGILSDEQAAALTKAGVRRYNHNLETSREFFPKICTTHDYEDRVRTAKLVKQYGMDLCCGGIFGLGESWDDRISLAFTLREINPNVVPLNFLDPREGTPLQNVTPLSPLEAIKIICLFRLALPRSIILCGGGREKILQDLQSLALKAGINALITGNYLTTQGDPSKKDVDMINKLGFHIARYN